MTPRLLRQAALIGAGAIGALALLGWVFDSPALYGGGLGFAVMRPIAAVLFVLAAAAFGLEREAGTPTGEPDAYAKLRASLAVIVALVGVAIVLARAGGTNAIAKLAEGLLTVRVSGTVVGPPSLLTGISFTSLAAAVLARRSTLRGPFLFSALTIAILALLGMLFSATIADADLFHESALPTALGLLLLAIGGLLADPDGGVIGALRRRGPASQYLRVSLLTALVVPTALGWVRVYLHREFAIPVEAGIALFAVTMIVVFSAVSTFTALLVERLDAGASALLQAAPEAMLVVDSAGTIRRANSQASLLFAAEPGALLGSSVDSLVPAALRGVHEGHRRAFAAPDGPRLMGAGRALLAQRLDGSQFRAEVTLSPLQVGEGHFVIAVVADVTEREEARRVLFESEARFRETFANAAVGVAVVGLHGEWLQVNQYLCDLLGYDEAELRRLTFGDVTHPDDLKSDLDLLLRLEAGEIPRYELYKRYIHKSGRIVHVLLGASVVRSLTGAPVHYIAIVQDVTESRRAQAALAETALLQDAILQGANLSIITTNADGVITTLNRGAERMLGYEAAELVGQRTPAVLHDADEVAARAAELSRQLGSPVEPGFETLVAHARRGAADENEWTYVRKDGGRVPVRLSVTALSAPEGEIQGFLGIAADVSEQRRAAEAMRESLQEKETMLREIHHRVKNNLQIVSSLLSLQAAASTHAELKAEFEEARDRIRSMAMLHEQLYRSERLSTVDLLSHLRELVGLQERAQGVDAAEQRCVVSGDDAAVSIDCAIPVGLIANELLSNAFRHGARGLDAPPIEISLRRVEDARYVLRVWNAPASPLAPVTLERSGALGLRLVRALLGQVDGSLTSEVNHGVALSVIFSDSPNVARSV